MKFLLVVAFLIGGAWFYLKPLPPGKGPDAEAGRRASVGMMNAIEAYRSARQAYPFTLEDMIPEFIAGVPHLKNGATFEYQRLGANYKLTFNYSNPLPVHCSHDSSSRDPWVCEWF